MKYFWWYLTVQWMTFSGWFWRAVCFGKPWGSGWGHWPRQLGFQMWRDRNAQRLHKSSVLCWLDQRKYSGKDSMYVDSMYVGLTLSLSLILILVSHDDDDDDTWLNVIQYHFTLLRKCLLCFEKNGSIDFLHELFETRQLGTKLTETILELRVFPEFPSPPQKNIRNKIN